ncbi:MAG: trimeric intracellular cation channel family protein [Ruminococcaceae bacterium]|nr:trimeric intracellular cation channel family protein [Oscillospiraceae bacterium]
MREILMLIMELLGTVAFAVSGTLVAACCGLDLFGVLTVGTITAVGGGVIRDLIIGQIPPAIFSKPETLVLVLVTSLVVFIVAFINSKKIKDLRLKIERINIFFDALGLAAFSVTGVEVTCAAGYSDNAVLAVVLGVITGVGGGVLRDVLVNEKPYILVKHIYAVASLIGAVVYYFVGIYFGNELIGTIISVLLTITIRMLAAKFRWNLPKVM